MIGDDKIIDIYGVFGSGGEITQEAKDIQAFFAGTLFDEVEGNILSDGTTITATVKKIGDGDVRYKTIAGVNTLICDPLAVTELVPNSVNYIYIDTDTNTFTSSIVGFPSGVEFVPLAITFLGSALFTQTNGTYKTHAWTDHLASSLENGHLSHLNEWIRYQHATHISGNALSYAGNGTATVQIAKTSGEMFQLHKHATDAIPLPADFYIVNDEVTAYRNDNNLATILTDANGDSINNKYFSLVFFYAHSNILNDSKIYVNKSSGRYSSESDARADALKVTDYSIPPEFRGTAILLHRMILRNSGGTLTIFDGAGDDLRGTIPNIGGGGGTAIGTVFFDGSFKVENTDDNTKALKLDVSDVSSGVTRVLKVPDKDGVIATTNDVLGKNILINPNNTVNQRGFNGDWNSIGIGVYGYDRWRKWSTTEKVQPIVEGNYIPNTVYTLSNNGTFVATLTSPASDVWNVVTLQTQNNLQLEEGSEVTKQEFRHKEIEEILCFPYYFVSGVYQSVISTVFILASGTTHFPKMRVDPLITIKSAEDGAINNIAEYAQNGLFVANRLGTTSSLSTSSVTIGGLGTLAVGNFARWYVVTDAEIY